MNFTKVMCLFLTITAVIVAQTAPAPSFSITPYGLVQYRLRANLTSQTDTADVKSKQNLYTNQIGFYAGFKATIGPQLKLQFQIGNDWITTETITYKTNNNPDYSKKGLFPYFHLAFANWNPGPFALSFGKIPVESFGPLDLLERSIATNTYGSSGSIGGASFVGWQTGTNGSLIAIKAEVPILKKTTKLAVNLTYSIINGDSSLNTVRGQSLSPNPNSNPNEQLFILDVPIVLKSFTLVPQFYTVLNRNYNTTIEEGDNEYGAGLSAILKIDKVSLRAKSGFATFGNGNSRGTDPEYQHLGFIGGIGASAPVGPGVANLEFIVSTDKNTKVDDSRYVYPYLDVKYAYNAVKYLDIIPRIRLFVTKYSEINALEHRITTRPELIFQAKF